MKKFNKKVKNVAWMAAWIVSMPVYIPVGIYKVKKAAKGR